MSSLERNCAEHGIPLYNIGSEHQGIVHVIGPELGLTQPGMTIACGDSHTSTHGAFGAVAFGIAAAQVAFEFSLGTLRQLLVRQPRRTVLLSGKALGILTFLAGAVVCSGIGGGVAALLMAHVRGIPTTTWTSSAGIADTGHALGDVALAVTGYGVLGMLAGLILRSPAPAAVVGFVYLLPFEGIFSAVVKGSERWLPGQVLSAISEGGTASVTFSHALVTATVYAVIAAALGTLLFTKRDVTA